MRDLVAPEANDLRSELRLTLGFDPARAAPSEAARPLVASAVAFVTPPSAPAPRGVLTVEIEVANTSRDATTRVRETLDPSLEVVSISGGGTRVATGEIEWSVDQVAGRPDRLGYAVRLLELAGTYPTSAEVTELAAGVSRFIGTYPLDLVLDGGTAEVAASAVRLANAISAKGIDAPARRLILAKLAAVEANAGATAEDREQAIGDLLLAADAARSLRTVDGVPLRLAIDGLLAVREARPVTAPAQGSSK